MIYLIEPTDESSQQPFPVHGSGLEPYTDRRLIGGLQPERAELEQVFQRRGRPRGAYS